MRGPWVDWLAFSSLGVALVAGSLAAVASLAMGLSVSAPVVGIAMAGTLVVYNVDRLRDRDRDRVTAPERSAFVTRHEGWMRLTTALAALAAVGFAWRLEARAAWLLAPVALLGLLHRRVKHLALLKAVYITVAWVTVVVGLPALQAGTLERVPWVALLVGLGIFANVIAFAVRDREAAAARFGRRPVLWAARGFATLGVALSLVAPAWARPLSAVPAATLAALAPFRGGEHYVAIAVDGALIAGAAIAAAWLAAGT